ncbi:hypothetical protein BJ165DRAFT_1526610 [Panaeolus papilionaceus]|nr:hypothetical protein BJ165DRAFT_1526610 [Panaeolus papilionaceus]
MSFLSTTTTTVNNSVIILSNQQCSPELIQHLSDLAQKSQELAFSQGYSSLLVGAGNESDEDSDLGLWLGKGDYHEPINVLKALGLEQWSPSITMESTKIPTIITEGMKNVYTFRISMEDSKVVFILVGQIESDDDGWGGLLGRGVWT